MAELRVSDGTRLHYEERGAGQGRPILLLGGWCMTTRWWSRQIPTLAASGHRVVAFDPRAYGRSEKVAHGHRLAHHARDLWDFMHVLGLRDVLAVGWSQGGNTLLAYVDLFGSSLLAGLAIVDQSPRLLNGPGWKWGAREHTGALALHDRIVMDQAAAIRALLPSMFRAPVTDAEMAWMVEEALLTPASAAAAIYWDHVHQDWRDVLPRLDVPVLVMAGRHSRTYPLGASSYIAGRVPDGRLLIFEESAHAPFYEEPDRFNASILSFARGLTEPGAPFNRGRGERPDGVGSG